MKPRILTSPIARARARHRPLLDKLEDEIHIWAVEIDQHAGQILESWQFLSRDERDRAERFRSSKAQTCFVVCRAALRQVLSRYLNVLPGDISFDYSPAGKPLLKSPRHPRLQLNIAHSGNLGVFALTEHDSGIGIDIEEARPVADLAAVTRQFFSPYEQNCILSIPHPQEQLTAFLRCWTRKEALLKATGEGLSHGLHMFEVNCTPDAPIALYRARHDPFAPLRWRLADIRVPDGYIGATAMEGPQRELVYATFSG